MTPDIFLECANKIANRILAQSLMRCTLISMHEAAASACSGEAENAYRCKLHALLDEQLDASNELVKLKELFVKSNR